MCLNYNAIEAMGTCRPLSSQQLWESTNSQNGANLQESCSNTNMDPAVPEDKSVPMSPLLKQSSLTTNAETCDIVCPDSSSLSNATYGANVKYVFTHPEASSSNLFFSKRGTLESVAMQKQMLSYSTSG
jgi:hypothetical protein